MQLTPKHPISPSCKSWREISLRYQYHLSAIYSSVDPTQYLFWTLSNTSPLMACSISSLSSSICRLFSPSWRIGMHFTWLGRGETHSDKGNQNTSITTLATDSDKNIEIIIAVGWALHPIMVHLRYKINVNKVNTGPPITLPLFGEARFFGIRPNLPPSY